MAKICEITGKRPQVGNRVSHAKNKTKRWFYPNLQVKKFFIAETGEWVILKVSTSVLRTINKKGISTVLKEAKKKGTLAQGLGHLVATGSRNRID
jgi:large subunit ribosomal protein L28